MDLAQATANEDWIKGAGHTWDVRDCRTNDPAITLEALCWPHPVTVQSIRHWVLLPCWQCAPAELKAEALHYLETSEVHE